MARGDTHERAALAKQLEKVGVFKETIQLFLSVYPPERIARQLRFLPYRKADDPAAVLVSSIRGDWSEPAQARQARRLTATSEHRRNSPGDAPAATPHTQPPPAQHANDIQAKLARIKSEGAVQKAREQRLMTREKELSSKQRKALRREAQTHVRESLGRAWPTHHPIPKSLFDAAYLKLIEERFEKKTSHVSRSGIDSDK